MRGKKEWGVEELVDQGHIGRRREILNGRKEWRDERRGKRRKGGRERVASERNGLR